MADFQVGDTVKLSGVVARAFAGTWAEGWTDDECVWTATAAELFRRGDPGVSYTRQGLPAFLAGDEVSIACQIGEPRG